MGSLTLLSRISGFIRDIIFASTFGASSSMEAFLVAFKIPNFMRRLFAEGSFTQAFVPTLSEYKEKYSHAETVEFIRNVVGTLGCILLVLTAFGFMFSGAWIYVFAPGFHDDAAKFILSESLLKITFPYIFFISLTALAGSVMNCFERFAVPAFTPVILNLCMIAFSMFSDQFEVPIYAIAWGVFFAGLAQLLFQIPFLIKLNVLAWPKWGWNHLGVSKLIKLMVPALFGASVAQISLLLDTVFASFLPTGSISWLYYADRLNQFPLGILGVALATVVLPQLSRSHASDNHIAYNYALNWALKMVMLFALPAAVAIFVLSGPMIITLFHHGMFNVNDVYESQKALFAFSVGLFSFVLVKVLVSAFYAKQNMKTPVKIGIIALVSNMVLNAILVISMMPYGLGHMGLAIATSLSSFINAGLLFIILIRSKMFTFEHGWLVFSLKIILACAGMVLVLFLLSGDMDSWLLLKTSQLVIKLSYVIIAGIITYFAMLYILGIRKNDILSKNH
jgi:putative peptidoglycan lipid II flippase